MKHEDSLTYRLVIKLPNARAGGYGYANYSQAMRDGERNLTAQGASCRVRSMTHIIWMVVSRDGTSRLDEHANRQVDLQLFDCGCSERKYIGSRHKVTYMR